MVLSAIMCTFYLFLHKVSSWWSWLLVIFRAFYSYIHISIAYSYFNIVVINITVGILHPDQYSIWPTTLAPAIVISPWFYNGYFNNLIVNGGYIDNRLWVLMLVAKIVVWWLWHKRSCMYWRVYMHVPGAFKGVNISIFSHFKTFIMHLLGTKPYHKPVMTCQ